MIALNNLTRLVWWTIIDLTRHQQVPTVADLTEDHLIAGHAAYEVYLINKNKDESIKGLPKFDPKENFDDWDQLVMEMLHDPWGAIHWHLALHT